MDLNDDQGDDLPGEREALEVSRLRTLLRDRPGATAKNAFSGGERPAVAQLRAAKASIPDDKFRALAEALASSVDAHVLTLEEARSHADRLATVVEPVARIGAVVERIERAAEGWEGSLNEAQALCTRASLEMPLRIAEAVAQVLKDAGASARAAVRWTMWVSVVLLLLGAASAVLSWRALAELERLTATSRESEVRPSPGGAGVRR